MFFKKILCKYEIATRAASFFFQIEYLLIKKKILEKCVGEQYIVTIVMPFS